VGENGTALPGVIPLDHAGIAETLFLRFKKPRAVIDWFSDHPDAAVRYRELRAQAKRNGHVELNDFVGFSYKEVLKGKPNIFAAFRYRRAAGDNRSLVLVDANRHPEPRAAVEAVLGPIETFEAVPDVSASDPNPERLEEIRRWFD
jgi:hypothetical protein